MTDARLRRPRLLVVALTTIALFASVLGISPATGDPARAAVSYGGVRLLDSEGDALTNAIVTLESDSQYLWLELSPEGTAWVGDFTGDLSDLAATITVGYFPIGGDESVSLFNWAGAKTLIEYTEPPTARAAFSPSSATLLDLALPLAAPDGSISETLSLQPSGGGPSYVDLYTAETGGWQVSARADDSGNFMFTGVPAGSYRMQFSSWVTSASAPYGYQTQYYDDALTFRSSTVVTIAADEARTGVDQALDAITVEFADVPGSDQFFFEIGWLAASGVTTGYPDGGFHPLGTVNRDAMAAFLYRYAGSPAFTPPASSPFIDVPTSSQFYREITWLASTGVLQGDQLVELGRSLDRLRGRHFPPAGNRQP